MELTVTSPGGANFLIANSRGGHFTGDNPVTGMMTTTKAAKCMMCRQIKKTMQEAEKLVASQGLT